jgi:LPXTG-site transpeptidase (sortase) family protein
VSRRRLLLAAPILLLAVALAGGLALWTGRDAGDAPPEQAQEAGPDIGHADVVEGEITLTPDFDETRPVEEYREALRAAIERQHHEQEAARQAEEAAARAEDEAVAARAVRAWGAGQLLLALPSIGVTAAVSSLGFEPGTRTPAIPYSAWGVGWYNFTDYPGAGGNAVFSGHVDYYTGEPAVFGRLASVSVGDPIYVVLGDGTPLAYQVSQSYYVSPYTADVGEIFGVTSTDAITFITCGGAWDAVAKDYSHRLIVRAYRVR